MLFLTFAKNQQFTEDIIKNDNSFFSQTSISNSNIFKVDKPSLESINRKEESNKQKEEEISIKNKNKRMSNIDDSLSTLYQTQNRKEEKVSSNNKKLINKKRKRGDSENCHNKYSYDNILKKCKHIVLKHVMNFINKKIKELYNNNIGQGINIKELCTIKKEQNSNANINYNKSFLDKKLVDIYSEDITSKITKHNSYNNKIVIQNLMNEKDDEKREYFNKLFNLSFLDCLNHFINKKSS